MNEVHVRQVAMALLSTINDTPEGAPEGVMYAAVMQHIGLETFNDMLAKFEARSLITRRGHVVYPSANLRELFGQRVAP